MKDKMLELEHALWNMSNLKSLLDLTQEEYFQAAGEALSLDGVNLLDYLIIQLGEAVEGCYQAFNEAWREMARGTKQKERTDVR